MKEHYHFIGIGGSGMGPLASLMLAKGYRVSGSDMKDNPTIAKLKDQGAHIIIGHNAKNITDPQYVVYSSAITPENPEMVEAKSKNIPILRRGPPFAPPMNTEKRAGVARGPPEKTTTSLLFTL